MVKQPAALTQNEIKYLRDWVEQYDIGDTFTLEGWKKHYEGDSNAPKATTVGRQIVAALEGTSLDP